MCLFILWNSTELCIGNLLLFLHIDYSSVKCPVEKKKRPRDAFFALQLRDGSGCLHPTLEHWVGNLASLRCHFPANTDQRGQQWLLRRLGLAIHMGDVSWVPHPESAQPLWALRGWANTWEISFSPFHSPPPRPLKWNLFKKCKSWFRN